MDINGGIRVLKKMAKYLLLIFLLIFFAVCFGCASEESEEPEKTNEENVFFGKWSLDRIVLTTIDYDGQKRQGSYYYERDYLGYEVEYNSQFFRLGDEIFYNPTYRQHDFEIYYYNGQGDFQSPDFYEFVLEEGIEIDRADEFERLEDVPLAYFVVLLEQEVTFLVGKQCALLNKDTMLVGVRGQIILAHRVE